MREFDERMVIDRRRQPTPALSRYTFFGRRKTIRRETDQLRGGYVDRYGSIVLFFVVSILSLNVLDALFTMMILESKGLELNPVVGAVMAIHGDRFWVWKFLIVSVSLVLLCLHSRFRLVVAILAGLSLIYLAIVLYQIGLLVLL